MSEKMIELCQKLINSKANCEEFGVANLFGSKWDCQRYFILLQNRQFILVQD